MQVTVRRAEQRSDLELRGRSTVAQQEERIGQRFLVGADEQPVVPQ